MNGRGKAIVLHIFLLMAMVACAQAELITIAIEATVDTVSDPCGHLEGEIIAGSLITGHYIYESTTPDSNPSNPKVGNYWHNQTPYGVYLFSNGFEFATDVNFMMEIVNDNSGIDAYSFESDNNKLLHNGVTVTEISWQLHDSTMTVLSDDALPIIAPVLSAWDENYLYIRGGPRGIEFSFSAEVTSATVVPEPATLVLIAVGAVGLRRRLL